MTFIKDDPAKAASLVANIQKLTDANKAKNLRSFIVFQAGPEQGPAVKALGEEKKITVPMTVLPQGPSQADIARFKINPEAKNTVMVYNRQKVVATFVNVDEKSFPEVQKAAEEMLK